MFWETFIKLKVDRIAPSVQENLKLTCLWGALYIMVYRYNEIWAMGISERTHIPWACQYHFYCWHVIGQNCSLIQSSPFQCILIWWKLFFAIHWEQMDVVRICHWSHQTMLLFWRTRFCRNWDLFINYSYFFLDLLIFWSLKPEHIPSITVKQSFFFN